MALFQNLSKLVLQPLHRQMRGLTLGTRTAVLDGQDRVLLVRHSYAAGWFLPGGGVERGETIFQSATREIREEAGIVAAADPALKGICLNDPQFPGDHIAVLVLRRFTREEWRPNLEISAAEFFGLDHLPEGTSAGTRRRLQEITSGQTVAAYW
jgi:8-oxo-dGTP pyrophosphatase MutT (NUDIX family)